MLSFLTSRIDCLVDSIKKNIFVKSDLSKKNKKQFRKILAKLSLEDRFTQIYKINYWNSSESASGQGSTLELTKNIRHKLPELFNKFSINSIFDGPCGDFNWMRLVIEKANVNYIGGDIVLPLIESNQLRFANDKIQFKKIDLTKDKLPKTDLMICRDCLFHLSYEDTRLILKNYVASNTPYLLTTSYLNKNSFTNKNIITGHFRMIDLFSTPYNFPRNTFYEIEDWLPPENPRSMYLWSREQIMEVLKHF